jgi:hypothetical protein
VPEGQNMHEASDSAPHEDEYFPAPHFMQSEAPSNEYLPGLHSLQAAADVAPTDSEYLPAGHACLSADPPGQ